MNETLDKLLPFEKNLFLALNGSESGFLDDVMWTYTSILTWMPMFAFIIYIAFKNQILKEGLLVLGTIALVALFSHQLSSSFFKPLFKRYRPTHHPDYINIVDTVNGFRGGLYGFISGHATMSFGLAMFLSLLFKNNLVSVFIFIWAALNSYSRIYLGVHFISDILAGLFFGVLIGFIVYKIYERFRLHYFKIPPFKKSKSIYSKKDGNILAIGVMSYIVLIILLSPILTSLSHAIIPETWF